MGVLGCGRDLINEVREQLDIAVRNVEEVLSAQGDDIGVAEELTLTKVQTCVQCFRDVVAPCEDGITAPLLKAYPEGIEWLHWVILAVWHVGRQWLGSRPWWCRSIRARAHNNPQTITKGLTSLAFLARFTP